MSIHDHPIDSSHSFWASATPQAKGKSRVEGFETEEASSVAKRILSQVTSTEHEDQFIAAFDHALEQRLKKMSAPPAGAPDLQVVVYETVSDALRKTFEQALYNGEKVKHQGRDLFTKDRAHVKAESVAGDLVQKLFERKMFGQSFKHDALLERLKHTAETHLGTGALSLPKDSQALDVRLEETKHKRKEVLASRDAMTIDQSDKWGQIQQSSQRLKGLLESQDPLQWRQTQMDSQAKEMLQLADRLCLRSLTQRALGALAQLPLELTNKANQMLELANALQRGEAGAQEKLSDFVEANDKDLQSFLRLGDSCLRAFPDLTKGGKDLPQLPSLEQVQNLIQAFESTKPGHSDHAKLGGELARMVHMMSLNQLRDRLQAQLADARRIFDDNQATIDLTDSGISSATGDSLPRSEPSYLSSSDEEPAAATDDRSSPVATSSYTNRPARTQQAQLAFDALAEWHRRQAKAASQ